MAIEKQYEWTNQTGKVCAFGTGKSTPVGVVVGASVVGAAVAGLALLALVLAIYARMSGNTLVGPGWGLNGAQFNDMAEDNPIYGGNGGDQSNPLFDAGG